MFRTWRDVLGYFEHVSPRLSQVKERYEELKVTHKDNGFAVQQLDGAWRKAKQEYANRTKK